jgi:hypothetical protein
MGRGRDFEDDGAGVTFAADTRAALVDCDVAADFLDGAGRALDCGAACGAAF